VVCNFFVCHPRVANLNHLFASSDKILLGEISMRTEGSSTQDGFMVLRAKSGGNGARVRFLHRSRIPPPAPW